MKTFGAKPLSKSQGLAAILVCSVMWSTSGLLIKLVPWNGMAIAGIRSLIASLVVLIYIKVLKARLVVNRFTLLSALLLCCCLTLFVSSNKLTASANAIVLQYCAPVFIILINALLFKVRPRWKDLAVVVVALGGVSLFFFDQLQADGSYMLGNIMALVSGIFMAAFYICGSRSPSLEENLSCILMGQFFTFLVSIPFMAFDPPVPTVSSVATILFLGIFQLGIPYILYGVAIKSMDALTCSMISIVEPLLNPAWTLIFLREMPGILAIIGAVIVLTGITVWSVDDAKAAKRAAVQDAGDKA
ncbi:MAG: DMT family transporter [Oscillospiraceae bacterium]|nr:DMT family transporter [Oscillospiraceae bacterium]